MGCYNDYQEPNEREKQSSLINRLLVKLYRELGKPVSKELLETAKLPYGNVDTLDEDTDDLCSLIKSFTPKQQKLYLDWNVKKWRTLAAWWEHHQEADKERIRDERREKREEALRKKGLSKLTLAERRALGLE